MSRHSDPGIATLPLLFHDGLAQEERDPEVLARSLAQHYTVLDFGPRPGSRRSFLHRFVSAPAGELILTCGYTSPIHGTIGETPGVGLINFCCVGSSTYTVDGLQLSLSPAQPLMLSPGLEYRYSVDHYNGLAFQVSMDRLHDTAAAIAGPAVSPRRFSASFEAPQLISLEDERRKVLLRLFRRELALLDDAALLDRPELAHLAIDDLIYRTLVMAFCPDLGRDAEGGASGAKATARQRVFEELLEWIRAHLGETISLTVLERRSGYSRRALQLAFQQRFGCGPMQWIRRQRLEQARWALLHPEPEDNVSSIASRCGFSSLAMFSRDFAAFFGQRPSDLLRDARRRQD
ncbi:MAG: helix-turn-helix domain-containing protein [Synechococcaceae cyanobacterium]